MNLPNKLTILRVLIIPFFVYALLISNGNIKIQIIACTLFIIASLTDLLDGYIARKYHLVTNFGKFMDPLADKLLVCSALICYVELTKIPAYIVIIIISREFIISGFRLIAAEQGTVIAAGYLGKFKTTFQMLMIIVLMIDLPYRPWNLLGQILMWIAVILTIVSLIDYIIKNKNVMLKGGM